MTQSQLGLLDPGDTSGDELAALLTGWQSAMHSMHSGATRPSYVVPGMQWLDTSGDPWLVKLWVSSIVGDAVVARIKPSTGVVDALRASTNLGDLPDKTAARANLGASAQMIGFTVSGGNETTAVDTSIDYRLTGTFVAVGPFALIGFSASFASKDGAANTAFLGGDLVDVTNGYASVAGTTEQFLSFSPGGVTPASRDLLATGLVVGRVYQFRMRLRANAANTCMPQGMLISGVNA